VANGAQWTAELEAANRIMHMDYAEEGEAKLRRFEEDAQLVAGALILDRLGERGDEPQNAVARYDYKTEGLGGT
jgi:hypothetical protein